METTVGRLLIDRALPPQLRGRPGPLDGKAIAEMMGTLTNDSDEYRDTVKKLMDVGRDVAYNSGGYSFGLSDMLVPAETDIKRKALRRAVKNILSDPAIPDSDRSAKIIALTESVKSDLEKSTFDVAKAQRNPLAMQVATGTRGKPSNLQGIMAGEGLYADHRDRSIPYPVTRGFAEGLSPAEYFAGSFGNRKSLYDVKMGTANSGFYGKMLTRAAHRLVVTAHEAENPDSIADRGIPVDTMDPDNDGALLGLPAGGYPRNTPLTPAVMKDLRDKGIEKLIVRSPIASGPPDGGVYARDLGYREHGKGRLSDIAEAVGITAAAAIAEPVSQASLGSKHSGGVAGAGPGGFKTLQQIVVAPKDSPFWAGHANRDGVVAAARPSPTGGHIVIIDGEEHQIAPGQDLTVNIGDRVEAGDPISTGLLNPSEITKHKGVGEGRRLFMDSFLKALRASNIGVNRRNVELLARGLVNHVEAKDTFGPYLPGDIMPYDRVEADWEPRPGHVMMNPKDTKNMYLEKPVLHYTIGTRLTPKTIDQLKSFGINNVMVHPDPPPFDAHFVSGSNTLFYDPDWQTRMYGSHLQKATLKGVWEGAESNEHGTSFVPGLAKGVDFGLTGKILRPGDPLHDKDLN